MTNTETVSQRLQKDWEATNRSFDAAVKAVESVKRKPKWAANELRRRAQDLVAIADRLKVWAVGRDERDGYLTGQFEEGVRTLAGGLKMTATAIERKDPVLLEGAAKIRTDGLAQVFAAKECAAR